MGHVNMLNFVGTLALVEVVSDAPTNGSRGHRIMLTRQAAFMAIASLVGMGVNYNVDNPGVHKPDAKIGVITKAQICGNRLKVQGYVWQRDMRGVVKTMSASADPLGMSFEATDVQVKSLSEEIWTLTALTFTGAAILPVKKAAFKSTQFAFVER